MKNKFSDVPDGLVEEGIIIPFIPGYLDDCWERESHRVVPAGGFDDLLDEWVKSPREPLQIANVR